jgi:phosphate-selective porin OprO/OprP
MKPKTWGAFLGIAWSVPAVSLAAILLAGTANAQDAASDKEQLEAMKRQLIQLQKKVDSLQGRVTHQEQRSVPVSAADVAALKAKKGPPGPIVQMTSGNRPGICTYDKFNCVYITGRLHFDAAAYSFSPSSALTAPQNPHNGINARRMRIGLAGNFMRDWHWTLVGDFGGSQDGAGALNNAFIQYRGFGNTWIEAGYMDVPYTLDEQVGSNNILFMERATAQVLAVDIAAGDNRSAIGFRNFGNMHWIGSYITGPVAGADHTTRANVGWAARAVFVPVRTDNFTFLVEGDYQMLITPQNNNTLRLRDRIEVRVDPGVRLLDTGVLANVTGADVWSGGFAGAWNAFYFQGEYFKYQIERAAGGDADFEGGYIQAAFALTGESRRYSTSNGAFGGINPKKPFLIGTGNWGAWEIAARYSYANLNDFDAAAVVRGGIQRNMTLGLNWYPNQNIRFMFNWIHGEVERFNAANVNLGAEYDVFATRMQIAF